MKKMAATSIVLQSCLCFLVIRSCHAHCHAPFQAAATMLLPGEVTATAWLPNCDVVSARQCSYPVSVLSGVHLPGKSTVYRLRLDLLSDSRTALWAS